MPARVGRRVSKRSGSPIPNVPLRFTQELWRALGEPPIRWLPAGHITAFLFRQTIASEILAAMELPRLVQAPRRIRPQVAPAPTVRQAA